MEGLQAHINQNIILTTMSLPIDKTMKKLIRFHPWKAWAIVSWYLLLSHNLGSAQELNLTKVLTETEIMNIDRFESIKYSATIKALVVHMWNIGRRKRQKLRSKSYRFSFRIPF